MNLENNGNSTERDLILLNGGVEIEVTLTDGSKETVKVQQIPIKAMLSYLACFDDEPRVIALVTGKPVEWVEQLTPASHTDLIEKGEEINRPFFDAWYQRRVRRVETLQPGFKKNLEGIIGRVAAEAVQKAGVSASASSASPSPIAAA